MSCKGAAFSYGYKGMAKHQLKSLATLSSTALQSVSYNCMRGSSAMRTIGWNGAEFSVRESDWKLMQNIEVENNCEVRLSGREREEEGGREKEKWRYCEGG